MTNRHSWRSPPFGIGEVLEADSLADGLAQARMAFRYCPTRPAFARRHGMSALPQFKAIDPDLPVVLLTGHGSIDLAVDALKLVLPIMSRSHSVRADPAHG